MVAGATWLLAADAVAAVSQAWRADPALVAIFLLVIGASLVAKPVHDTDSARLHRRKSGI